MNKCNFFIKIKHFILLFFAFLKETFHLLFALSLVLGLFYLRLLPKVSRDLWDTMTPYQFLTTVTKVILLLMNIVILLRILKWLPEKHPSKLSESFAKLFKKVSDYVIYMLINFYEFLGYNITFLGKYLFGYEHLFYHILRKIIIFTLKKKRTLLYMALVMLKLIPKTIFIVVFAYDVLLAKQLYYTFLCLPILLIPLLEQFILFAFTNFYESNWDPINSFMQSRVIIDENNVETTQYKFIPEFQNEIPEWFESFDDFFYNHYKVLNNLYVCIEEYKWWKQEIAYYYTIQLLFCVIRLFLLVFTLLYNII